MRKCPPPRPRHLPSLHRPPPHHLRRRLLLPPGPQLHPRRTRRSPPSPPPLAHPARPLRIPSRHQSPATRHPPQQVCQILPRHPTLRRLHRQHLPPQHHQRPFPPRPPRQRSHLPPLPLLRHPVLLRPSPLPFPHPRPQHLQPSLHRQLGLRLLPPNPPPRLRQRNRHLSPKRQNPTSQPPRRPRKVAKASSTPLVPPSAPSP
jgi:hypothetical protein